MESRKKLIYWCTLIIFNGSAQHAAVNFGQFDIYGFVPNAPFTLHKPPPTKKGKTTFADILESLPNLLTAGLSAGLAFSLAQFSPDEVSVIVQLCNYLYTYHIVYCVFRSSWVDIQTIGAPMKLKKLLQHLWAKCKSWINSWRKGMGIWRCHTYTCFPAGFPIASLYDVALIINAVTSFWLCYI